MGTKKMGFEGELYYGSAGSTAASKLTNCRDVTISYNPTRSETTVKGDGSAPPVETQRVASFSHELQWTMLHDATDSDLEALRVAATAGDAVALRGKDYSSGKGPDMDYTLQCEHGVPYQGEQTYQFTAAPTEEGGRTPTASDLYK